MILGKLKALTPYSHDEMKNLEQQARRDMARLPELEALLSDMPVLEEKPKAKSRRHPGAFSWDKIVDRINSRFQQ
jgi:hypothetical protein